MEEKDWITRGVLAVALCVCMLSSHAVLSQWGIARHLYDFGLIAATDGFNKVHVKCVCEHVGWIVDPESCGVCWQWPCVCAC